MDLECAFEIAVAAHRGKIDKTNNDEIYSEFIERAAYNQIGRAVKITDLNDNLKLSRISKPAQTDFARIDRCRAALQDLGSQATELVKD